MTTAADVGVNGNSRAEAMCLLASFLTRQVVTIALHGQPSYRAVTIASVEANVLSREMS